MHIRYGPLLGVVTVVLCYFLNHAPQAHAQSTSQYLMSPIAQAMGNGHVAMVTDEYSLIYNPAGLGRNSNWRVSPLNLTLGATDQVISLIDTMGGFSLENLGASISSLAGRRVYGEAYLFPYIQIPFMAFGGVFRMKADAEVNNPVYPIMRYSIFTEYTGIGGFGFPIIPKYGFIGASVAWVARSNAITEERLSADGAYGLATSRNFDSLMRGGHGWSTNIGVQFQIPTATEAFTPVIGATWENVGTLKFRNDSPTLPKPVSVPQSLNLGLSLTYKLPVGELTFAGDYRRLLDTDENYSRKINLGLRLKLPSMVIYCGLNQGYPTYGVSFKIPFFDLDLVSYAEELGSYAGARGDRRYMMRFTLGFDFEGFSVGQFDKRRR